MEYAENYKDSTNIKPQSKERIKRTIDHLKEYFGTEKKLRQVSKEDALSFYNWMIESSGLKQNTINRRASTAREIFAFAIESDLLAKNPFKQKLIKTSVGAAKKKEVTKQVILDVIEHCPTTEWKLLFAFARFVGCRIPSEIQNLTWADIDRDKNQIRLWDEKREKNKTVPLFPEVEQLIAKQYDEVPDCEVYVFPNLRLNKNPGTTAKKYVKKAGYEVWNSFFNTLRANRETELMDEYGIRKACAWIGNTPETAMKNYSIVRGSDFDDSDRAAEMSDFSRVLRRVQNPSEQQRMDESAKSENAENLGKVHKKSPLVVDSVIPLGLEPRTT